ncbi:MAG: site-specific DNA-methyltransferase [Metamycoplasmataceae bacterium]
MKITREFNAEIDENRIKELEKIFPEVVTDGVIDFDKFKNILNLNPKIEEKFGLSWFGKQEAEINAKSLSKGTLRPCVNESKYWDETRNLYIEGDNLEVLKLLQKSYANKVDIIYIDPPYNTGNEFIYKDSFKDSIKNYKKITNQIDENNNNYSTNKESSGRYHSNWLSMMYPRLKLAKNLMKEDGAIFISINDNEQARLKILCDEIFGENNFVATINWQSSFGGKNDSKLIPVNTEYILCYSQSKKFEKNIDKNVKFNFSCENEIKWGKFNIQPLCRSSLDWSESLDFVIYVRQENDSFQISFEEQEDTIGIIVAGPTGLSIDEKMTLRKKRLNGEHSEKDWRFYWSRNTIQNAFDEGFIYIKEEDNQFFIYQKIYEKAKYNGKKKEVEIVNTWKTALRNVISDTRITNKRGNEELIEIFREKLFSYPKPTLLINKLLSIKKNDALVLDFFSGSSTTAHAIIKLNAEDNGKRKFIMIQIPDPINNSPFKNICEIGKERIRRAGELILKENNRKLEELKNLSKLDIGFRVLKLDDSNIRESNLNNYSDQTSLFWNNIHDDRTAYDLLFESLIKLGFVLDRKITEYKINDNTIYVYGKGEVMACFDRDINMNVISEIIKLKEEMKPEDWKLIFRDNGFDSDKTKVNARELIRSSIKDSEGYKIKDVFNTI